MSSEQAQGAAKRVAIIGAGPIGIEAALYASTLGHDVTVYERGDLAQAVQSWGHVTLFSPWRMNTSPLGRACLEQAGFPSVAQADELERCPRGSELFDRYLLPLSQIPRLSGRLRLHHRVLSVGRPWLLKGEQIGKASRSVQGFQLLLQAETSAIGSATPAAETLEYADVVLDCSGTFASPNPIGAGGMPAIGERALGDRILRHPPDVLGKLRARFAGRRVLIVGGGHSAATAAVHLAQLLGEGTSVIWAQRDHEAVPFPSAQSDSEDPLSERRQLHLAANRLPSQAGVRYLAGTMVSSLRRQADDSILVTLVRRDRAGQHGEQAALEHVVVDEVLGLTGYGPDRSIYEQLQVHECYASFGPMKLAAVLLGASGDCLAQPTPGPETLKNPEPNFFILGAKSYGRNSAFLLQIGHAQIRSVFQLLHGQPDLDLYAGQQGRA